MPRTLPSGIAASLGEPVLDMTELVRIQRADGVVFGFTSNDSAIVYGGLTYEPVDGLQLTGIVSAVGTGVDNLNGGGFLSSSRITEADIVAGLYADARLEVRIYDRSTAEATAPIVAGYMGEITVADGVFTCEFRSLSSRMNTTVGDLSAKNCRVRRLGDAQCKVNLAGTVSGRNARSTRTVSAASGSTITFASESAPTDFYKYGVVRFTSGLNNGLEAEVKTHTLSAGSAVIELRSPFPFSVAVSDTAELTVGCDRTRSTCISKFANVANFHGEPLLPGNEVMTTQGRGNG